MPAPGFNLCDSVIVMTLLLQELAEKTADAGLPPCSTLFIANLGPTCTEDELNQVLSQ